MCLAGVFSHYKNNIIDSFITFQDLGFIKIISFPIILAFNKNIFVETDKNELNTKINYFILKSKTNRKTKQLGVTNNIQGLKC